MAEEPTAEQTAPERTVVYLGNRKAVITQEGGERVPVAGKRCTRVTVAEGSTLLSAVHDIVGPAGLWAHMSDADAPAWVAAEGPLAEGLLVLLQAQYPGVEVRDVEIDDGAEAA